MGHRGGGYRADRRSCRAGAGEPGEVREVQGWEGLRELPGGRNHRWETEKGGSCVTWGRMAALQTPCWWLPRRALVMVLALPV